MIEEVTWLRVLVGPGLDVRTECIVKALWPQDVFAKHHQANSWLHVGNHTKVSRVGNVWIVVNSFAAIAGEVAIEIAGLLQARRVFSLVEGIGTVVVDEGIEALIHPGVAALVGADDHREPVVSKLVVGHAPKRFSLGLVVAEVESWVFHATNFCGHIGCSFVREFIPLLGVVFDGCLAVFCRSGPGILSIAFHRVGRLCECLFAARQVDA